MSAFGNLRERLVNTARRPAAYFAGEWERWSPRERRLVTWGAAAVTLAAILLGVVLTFSSIGELEDGNASIREALGEIGKHRDEYLEAKSRNAVQEARIGNDPPQLTGDLEAAARAENVQIAESNERPDGARDPALPPARRRPQDPRGGSAEPDQVPAARGDRAAAGVLHAARRSSIAIRRPTSWMSS